MRCAFFGGAIAGTAQVGTPGMAVRSAAEGQREPLVPAMAALPERQARLAAEASVVRVASRAAAARLGDKLREQVAARATVPQEMGVFQGAPEAKEPEVFQAPVGTLAAQGREAGAPRERAAWPVRVA